MEDLLISTLETLGYPVRLQGSLLEDEPYQNHFFTFWNNSSSGVGFYDNSESSCAYSYDVNFYSIDAELVYTKLDEAITKLKKAGFIVSGHGHSVGSDEKTHDGRGITILYLEN